MLTSTLTLLTPLAVGLSLAPAHAGEPDVPGLFSKLDANGDGRVAADEVKDEHQLLFKRLLRTGDDNGDDQLSITELAAALQPLRAEKTAVEKQGSRLPGADALVVLMAKMDANEDQQLDQDEIPQGYVRAFDQMLTAADGDKNGRLDRKEIAQGAPRLSIIARGAATRLGLDLAEEMNELPAGTMASIERMDAYQLPEGIADPATIKRMSRQLLQQFDANRDGKLTSREAPPRLRQNFERADADGNERLDLQELEGVAERMLRIQSIAENRKKSGPAATEDAPAPKRDEPAKRAKKKLRKKGLK